MKTADIAADITAFLTLDPEAHRNRHELYSALRAQNSVHHDAVTGMYLVSDPDAIREILLDDGETYSSAEALSPPTTAASDYMESILTEEQREHFIVPKVSVITSDGDRHRRLRKAIQPFFATTAVRRRHNRIRAGAGAILDGLSGKVDWVDDFCRPLTTHTIVDIIGAPGTDFDTVARWNGLLASLATGANVTANTIGEYIDFTKEFTEYFRARADQVRENPDSSLLSHLLAQGDDLTEMELLQLLLIIFPAGTFTTVMVLSHIATRMTEDPGIIERLRANPDTIPELVEGWLVERSPTASLFRTTMRPTTVQGTEIPAGASLLLVVGAANQDLPDIKNHLAFGHGGHRCVGAPLARTQITAALEAVVERYDGITLTQPLDQLPVHPHLFFPAYLHLYVELHRRKSNL
jgi:cytochrome P450